MGRAVKGMVTAEMLLTLTGIGAMIMQYGSAFATDSLFAVILTILLIAMIADESWCNGSTDDLRDGKQKSPLNSPVSQCEKSQVSC